MNIEHCWHTFNIAEAIAAFIPFESKKYVKKFISRCPDDISTFVIEHSINDTLKATLVQRCNILPLSVTNPIYVYGISMRDLWDNVLEELAKLKNMKNAEELCIWLDMKDS